MSNKFEMVKNYLQELELNITHEEPSEELVVVEDVENGIQNLVIDCEDPIVILEQFIMETPKDTGDLYKNLLQMNRSLVHGAFVLNEDASKIIFRDTLQLANLDLNELEGSIQALSLAMAEFGTTLLGYVK